MLQKSRGLAFRSMPAASPSANAAIMEAAKMIAIMKIGAFSIFWHHLLTRVPPEEHQHYGKPHYVSHWHKPALLYPLPN